LLVFANVARFITYPFCDVLIAIAVSTARLPVVGTGPFVANMTVAICSTDFGIPKALAAVI
jgi:hypothetical protein